MGKIQLKLDFGQPITPKSKGKTRSVQCQECNLPIDLAPQRERVIKACPHCGDRDWLLNLKKVEACLLYSIPPESLGGRLRD